MGGYLATTIIKKITGFYAGEIRYGSLVLLYGTGVWYVSHNWDMYQTPVPTHTNGIKISIIIV